MSKNKEDGSPVSQILIAVVIALLVGSTTPWWWPESREIPEQPPVSTEPSQGQPTEPPVEPQPSEPSAEQKCVEPWAWDSDFQSCTRVLTIPAKTFSILLDRTISSVNGRIDFYANTERLPGADSAGRAMYNEHNGALQVVIPIMYGDTMVGDEREVIFSTNEGVICKVADLPETTGWLKKMKVGYSLALTPDCTGGKDFCQAVVMDEGHRARVIINELTVTIGKNCQFKHSG